MSQDLWRQPGPLTRPNKLSILRQAERELRQERRDDRAARLALQRGSGTDIFDATSAKPIKKKEDKDKPSVTARGMLVVGATDARQRSPVQASKDLGGSLANLPRAHGGGRKKGVASDTPSVRDTLDVGEEATRVATTGYDSVARDQKRIDGGAADVGTVARSSAAEAGRKNTDSKAVVKLPRLSGAIEATMRVSGLDSPPSTTPRSVKDVIALGRNSITGNMSARSRHSTKDDLTPRHRYYQDQSNLSTKAVEIMMLLDGPALETLRLEFRKYAKAGTEVDLYEFTAMVQECLGDTEGQYLEALSEVFKEIDVNGDGDMSWEEFTTYLVDLANTYYADHYEDHLGHYVYGPTEDETRHDYHIDYVKYIHSLEKLIVIERSSSRFKVYDPQFKLEHTVNAHRASVLAAEYIPHMKLLATTSADRTVCFWENNAGKEWHLATEWTVPHAQVALCMCEAYLYTSETSGDVLSWHTESGSVRRRFVGHTDVALGLVGIPRDRKIASASLDTTIRVWDVDVGKSIITMTDHEKPLVSLAYAPRQSLLISAGLDNYAMVWSTSMSKPVQKLTGFGQHAHLVGVEVSRKNFNQVAVCDNAGTVQVFDMRTWRTLQTLQVPKMKQDNIACMTMMDDLIVTSGDRLHLFSKTVSMEPQRAFNTPVQHAEYNDKSLTFVTGSERCVKVWSALTGRLEREYDNIVPNTITAMCLDDRKRRLFIGDHAGHIHVLNYANGAPMKKLDSHTKEVSALAHAGEGSEQAVSASWDGTAILHADVINARKTTLKTMASHTGDVGALDVSEALGIVATGGTDCKVALHNIRHALEAGSLSVFGPVTCVRFLGGHHLLAVSDQSGMVGVYLLRGEPQRLCGFQNRHVKQPKYNMLGREVPNDETPQPCAVTCLQWDEESMTIYTSDEAGYWKAWSLRSFFLTFLQVDRTDTMKTPKRSDGRSDGDGHDNENDDDDGHGRKFFATSGKEEVRKSSCTENIEADNDADDEERLAIALEEDPGQAGSSLNETAPSESTPNAQKSSSLAPDFPAETRASEKKPNHTKDEFLTVDSAGSNTEQDTAPAAVAPRGGHVVGVSETDSPSSNAKSSLRKGQSKARKKRSVSISVDGGDAISAAQEPTHTGSPSQERYRRSLRKMSVFTHFVDMYKKQVGDMPLEPFRVVHAHFGHINGIQLIKQQEHPDCLLTWGDDGHVFLWNAMSGKKLGSLTQGYNKSMDQPLEPWDFQVDLKSRRREYKQTTVETQAKVRERWDARKAKALLERQLAQQRRKRRQAEAQALRLMVDPAMVSIIESNRRASISQSRASLGRASTAGSLGSYVGASRLGKTTTSGVSNRSTNSKKSQKKLDLNWDVEYDPATRLKPLTRGKHTDHIRMTTEQRDASKGSHIKDWSSAAHLYGRGGVHLGKNSAAENRRKGVGAYTQFRRRKVAGAANGTQPEEEMQPVRANGRGTGNSDMAEELAKALQGAGLTDGGTAKATNPKSSTPASGRYMHRASAASASARVLPTRRAVSTRQASTFLTSNYDVSGGEKDDADSDSDSGGVQDDDDAMDLLDLDQLLQTKSTSALPRAHARLYG